VQLDVIILVMKAYRLSMMAFLIILLGIGLFGSDVLINNSWSLFLFIFGVIGLLVLNLYTPYFDQNNSIKNTGLFLLIGSFFTILIYATTLIHLGIVIMHILISFCAFMNKSWRRMPSFLLYFLLFYLILKFLVSPEQPLQIPWIFFDLFAFSINYIITTYMAIQDKNLRDTLIQTEKLVKQLSASNELLVKRSLKDHLTNLLHKDIFQQETEEKIKKLKTGETSFLFFIDIDDFKNINDTYGHLFGDKVLQDVANILESHLLGKGFGGRFGGEELLGYLHNTDQDSAQRVIKEIVQKVSSTSYKEKKGSPTITVSIGVTEVNKDSHYPTLLELADQAMYKVKKNGKNGYHFI